MPTDRGSARRRTIAVATVAIIAIAGGLGGFFILNGQDGKSSTIVNDGPTFHDALGAVNLSVNTVSGGPWVLSQVYGVASPVPSSPTSWGWGEYDNTLASCQAAFNGLTIWNGTIPLFDGSFNSGTAPFWQFVFFSNTTLQILVATDVLGVVHAYPPILMSSPCGMYSRARLRTVGRLVGLLSLGVPGGHSRDGERSMECLREELRVLARCAPHRDVPHGRSSVRFRADARNSNYVLHLWDRGRSGGYPGP